jgi:hypothetical protein
MTDNSKVAEAEARFVRLRNREPELSQAWVTVTQTVAALNEHRTLLATAEAAFSEADHEWTLIQSRQLQPNDDAHAASVSWHRANIAVRDAASLVATARATVEKAELAEKLAHAEFARVREGIPSAKRAWQELITVQQALSERTG